jgi:hypothetical protein
MILPPAKSDEITGSAWEKVCPTAKKNSGISNKNILFTLIIICI